MTDQRPRGGRIINNGSMCAHVPRPNSVPYMATKHAIDGLTRSISLDGRKCDIAYGRTANEPLMDIQHVAGAVLLMVPLPLDTNVQFPTTTATKMPFIGRS